MTWSDIPIRPSSKILRQFAVGWLVFFTCTGAYQFWARGHAGWGITLAGLGVGLGIWGWIKPCVVRPIFVTWMVLAFPIGWLISQGMLLVMFYVVLTPVAVLFRLRGRDSLCLRPLRDRTSFWHPRGTKSDVRSYFRQY